MKCCLTTKRQVLLLKPVVNCKRILGLLLLALLLINCNNSKNASGDLPTSFFDVSKYFDNQVAQLDSLQPSVLKNASLNGKTEVQNLDSLEWRKELKLFKSLNINKPSWKDSYEVDTLLALNEKIIEYKLLDKDLPVKKLVIKYDLASGNISSISGTIFDKNMLYHSELELNYIVNPDNNRMQEFSIKGSQKIFLLQQKTYEITVELK